MAAKLKWTDQAIADLDRLEAFLYSKSPRAAGEAIDTILDAVFGLLDFPLSGRSLNDEDEDDPYREMVVPFSNSGYLVLHAYDGGTVEIHHIRHQREDGY